MTFTSIVPKLAVQISANTIETLTPEEFEQNIANFKRSERANLGKYMKEYYDENPTSIMEFTAKVGEAMRSTREKTTKAVRGFEDGQYDEWERRQRRVVDTAMLFSRISPTSCYSFTLHSITGSSLEMVDEFRNSLRIYRDKLADYLKGRQVPSEYSYQSMLASIGIKSFDTDNKGIVSVQVLENYQPKQLDLTGMPAYRLAVGTGSEQMWECATDINVLLVYAVVLFMGIIIAFALYDVR